MKKTDIYIYANLVSISNMNCNEFASVLYRTFSKVIPGRSNDDKRFSKSLWSCWSIYLVGLPVVAPSLNFGYVSCLFFFYVAISQFPDRLCETEANKIFMRQTSFWSPLLELFELRSVLCHRNILNCWSVMTNVAGKCILVIKYAHNAYNRTRRSR